MSAHPRTILGVAALLGAVSAAGASRIVVQDSWLAGFAPTSELSRETRRFNEQFLGTHLLLVSVEPVDRPLTGDLPEGDVGHREIGLPPAVTGAPGALVNRRIALWHASKPGKVWASSISAARRGDGRITLEFPKGSSPRFVLSPAPGERLLYEIASQPLVQPEAIDRIGALETFIEGRKQDAVGGVLGPAKYLATTSFLHMARGKGTRIVPRDPERIEELWSSYRMVRGDRRLQQLVDPGRSRGLVTVFLKDANFIGTRHLMDALREYERTELLPRGLALGFAGDVAVSQTLIEGIVSTQVRSLLLSLAGVLLVVALLGRSLRWGLISMTPCAASVLMSFGLMGWLGTPLGVATSMFASMTVGIGVDYAIHLLDRYRLECGAGFEPRAALLRSMAITGPAILTDALGVSLGFGILLLSQVPANAHIGARVSISILGCLAGTLIILPALLALRQAKRERPPPV